MGASVACGVLMERAMCFSTLQRTNVSSAGIWLGSGAVCNIGIVACITFHLEKRVGNSKTTQIDIMAENVIRLSIENGSLTAIVSAEGSGAQDAA